LRTYPKSVNQYTREIPAYPCLLWLCLQKLNCEISWSAQKPTNRNKKRDIHCMEYYPDIQKNKIMLFLRKWMELEIIMQNEISQVQKAKYHMFLFICRT
jgi:hypothetical protein